MSTKHHLHADLYFSFGKDGIGRLVVFVCVCVFTYCELLLPFHTEE